MAVPPPAANDRAVSVANARIDHVADGRADSGVDGGSDPSVVARDDSTPSGSLGEQLTLFDCADPGVVARADPVANDRAASVADARAGFGSNGRVASIADGRAITFASQDAGRRRRGSVVRRRVTGISLLCSTYQCPRLASFMAPQSLGGWPFCCNSCVRTGGEHHDSTCVMMPAGNSTATNPYPSNSQPSLSPAPAPDPPLPASSPGRPPPAANREGSVGASLASVDSDDSQLRCVSAALPSVGAYSVQVFSRPPVPS